MKLILAVGENACQNLKTKMKRKMEMEIPAQMSGRGMPTGSCSGTVLSGSISADLSLARDEDLPEAQRDRSLEMILWETVDRGRYHQV
jgi:hypothetical protein